MPLWILYSFLGFTLLFLFVTMYFLSKAVKLLLEIDNILTETEEITKKWKLEKEGNHDPGNES